MRLGVNVDHVATLRNARGEIYPDPIRFAKVAESAGANNITMHLREDRRHIKDQDIFAIQDHVKIPLNFEIANTTEMIEIALKILPHAVTLVPEKRQELTTEGGLDTQSVDPFLKESISKLIEKKIEVALFLEPDQLSIDFCRQHGGRIIEFHTGAVCIALNRATSDSQRFEIMQPLIEAANYAHKQGVHVHLGHGINYDNARWMQLVPHAVEANIGHAIVAQALDVGFESAVKAMKSLIQDSKHRPHI